MSARRRRRTRHQVGVGSAYFDPKTGGFKGKIILDGKEYWARGATEEEVLAKHQAKKAEVERRAEFKGVTDLDPDTLFGDWLTMWMRQQHLRVDTGDITSTYYTSLEYQVRCQIRPVLGLVRVGNLKPDHVRLLHRDVLARGLSKSTLAQAHRVLRAAIRPLVEEHQILTISPTRQVSEPSLRRNKRPDAYTTDEVAKLAAMAEIRGDLAMSPARVMVSAWMGLREGEACGLQTPDVSLSRQELTVERTLSRQPWRHGYECDSTETHKPSKCPWKVRAPITGTTKSEAGERTLPIPDVVLPYIREQMRRVSEARLAGGGTWPAEQWLFPNPEAGRRQSVHADQKRWAALARAALGEDATTGTHAARRHAATRLAEEGVPITVAMKALGWSRAELQDIYARVSDHVTRAELNRAFEGARVMAEVDLPKPAEQSNVGQRRRDGAG